MTGSTNRHRLYAIRLARRSVFYLCVLLIVMVGSFYMVFYSDAITPERYGLLYVVALPFVLAGGLMALLARRRALRLAGVTLAAGFLLAATVITALYAFGYIPQECHTWPESWGWYVHCHESGYSKYVSR